MLLAAEIDGRGFRLAQFTRFARDAVVEATVEPMDGRLRFDMTVQQAAGRLAGLLTVLEKDGAAVHGHADDEKGWFQGTVDVEVPAVGDPFLAQLATLRAHAHQVRLRIHGGRVGLIADVRAGDLHIWRELLGELDDHWTLLRPTPQRRLEKLHHS